MVKKALLKDGGIVGQWEGGISICYCDIFFVVDAAQLIEKALIDLKIYGMD
jgi:hypothetical protein